MIKIEYYDSIELERLYDFREKMTERIFCKKRNDGQKGKKNYSEVSKEINRLDKEYKIKVHGIIDNAEKFNIHPNELLKLNNYLLSFYPFSELNTTPEFMILDVTDDEPLKVISNEGEYYEKSFLDKLIKGWFASNGKVYPEDDSNIEFFYDYDLSFILGAKKNKFNNEIGNLKTYDYFIFKAKIYTYRNNIESDISSFNSLSESFVVESESYNILRDELIEESIYSDRGSIFVDVNHPAFIYKINGQDIYQFSSQHFWKIYDEFILLQANQSDLFGKGAESILKELHKIFSGKDERYWGSFEEFKLQIQQQYLYIANEERGLRLDLFRNISTDGDFEGGVWHGFKHFKLNGTTLSAKSGGGKNYDEHVFFNMLREAFFVQIWNQDKKGRWNVSIPYSKTEGVYIFGFHENKYLDSNNNMTSTLYSLNTVIYKSQ
jgi:hypothetical protein